MLPVDVRKSDRRLRVTWNLFGLIIAVLLVSGLSRAQAKDTNWTRDSYQPASPPGTELLPDLIVPPGYLADRDYSTSIVPGRRFLRLSNGTANVGAGKLYLYGVLPPTSDSTQQVNQRVYDSNGGFTDYPSGQFVYHASHSHIHVENWCQYRLRTILPGDGVGPIIAGGAKTSFCILDLVIYDNTLPGFSAGGEFTSCSSTIQGLSIGWTDIYHKELAGQNIDVTDVPPGQYWLESEVDPANIVRESNESNNITRIKITITAPQVIGPDRYEGNDTRADVIARVEGQINSPNLGPTDPQLTIDSLTIHASANQDYFRFYINATGTSSDFVKINFLHSSGDIDMLLLDSNGTVLGRSESVSDSEFISLNGRPKGHYFAQIYGFNGALAPWYKLTINPPANAPPTLTMLTPPAGNVTRLYAVETYPISWTASDPSNDPLWVTFSLDSIPVLDGDEQLLSTSFHLPAANSPYLINSAGLAPGKYFVHGDLTDGGTTVGAWSAGSVTFVPASQARYVTGVIRGFDPLPLSGAIASVAAEGRIDTSDANGRILLGAFSTSSIPVQITALNYRTLMTNVPLTLGETSQVDLTLSPIPASALLHVQSLSGGALANAAVSVSPWSFNAVTNLSGDLSIDSIPPGSAVVHASLSGYYSDSLSLAFAPNQHRTDTLKLRPVPAHLAIHVRDTGNLPVFGAIVTLTPGGPLSTDLNGNLSIDSLDPGLYTYSVSGGSPFHAVTENVSLQPGEIRSLTITLQYRPASVLVHVQAADSTPLTQAAILVTRDNFSGITNQAGDFLIDSLPMGAVVVRASHTGYRPDSASFNLQAGKTDTIRFTLSPLPGELTVHLLRDNSTYSPPPHGSPRAASLSAVIGAYVLLSRTGSLIDSLPTDSSGTAHFVLPPGSYTVSSRPYGYLPDSGAVVTVADSVPVGATLTLVPICAYRPGDIDLDGSTDIGDLTVLVDYLFISFTPPADPAHANLDGSADGVIDIGDLTLLVSNLFIDFQILPCLDYLAPQ